MRSCDCLPVGFYFHAPWTAKSLPIARKTGSLAIKYPEIVFRVAIHFSKNPVPSLMASAANRNVVNTPHKLSR
jgi:hypothetical protein